jgi:hypothetical protein
MKSYMSQFNLSQGGRSPVLGLILLVESGTALCQSRAHLLSALSLPVQKAAGYCDVCGRSGGAPFSLVAISLAPNQAEAEKVVTYVRRQWSSAKILLLGRLSGDFDDPLYDEIVDASFNPSAFVEASKGLLRDLGATLSVHRESYRLQYLGRVVCLTSHSIQQGPTHCSRSTAQLGAGLQPCFSSWCWVSPCLPGESDISCRSTTPKLTSERFR